MAKSLVVMRLICWIFIFISFFNSAAQNSAFKERTLSISNWIDGTLLLPNATTKPDLAIIIAGSGPVNRDGNQNFMKNNALKKLAVALAENGIASYRYDKRSVKQIRQGRLDNDIMFDDFVSDASDIIAFFQEKEDFGKLVVIGHSQGSLVGILACNELVDGFISLAGAGQNIGDVILEQISKTAPMLAEDAKRTITSLKNGQTTEDYPQALSSVFNSSLQPFMINWMEYNPNESIKELQMPVLVINGTKDLQVPVSEAELLADNSPNGQLAIIEDMNHVLFKIDGDDLENSKSYNESFRPISTELVETITQFIKSL